MKRLVEFPLESGGYILAEVEVPAGKGLVPAATPEAGVAGRAMQTFEAALEKVKPAAGSLIQKLSDLSPGEIEMEFGITLSADAGAFLASAGAEAHFKVTLTWTSGEQAKNAPKNAPKNAAGEA
jgi:hypothetical protein